MSQGVERQVSQQTHSHESPSQTPQSEVAAIFTATAAKLLLYDIRVNFNLGFEIDEGPDERKGRFHFELWSMALAVCVESVGNVVAMAVQKWQGVSHVSMLTGERWRETMLFLTSSMLVMTAAMLYSFSLRNVGWYCTDKGGDFCGCTALVQKNELLSAFCCAPGE